MWFKNRHSVRLSVFFILNFETLEMKSKYIDANGVKLHLLDSETKGRNLILLHGLTANAHAFDGLIDAGLGTLGRVLSVDLRGRGLSEQPPSDYAMRTHAADIVALIEAMDLKEVVLVGHSFGALMSWHLAQMIPEKISGIVFLDAAARLHPDTRAMLAPTMSRLGQVFPSKEAYLKWAKEASFLDGMWNPHLQAYFEADIEELPNGRVRPISRPETIAEAVNGALGDDWVPLIKQMIKPAVLIHAPEAYDIDREAPLLPTAFALETVEWMPNCRYVAVTGNHQTMLYGQGAKEIVEIIREFLDGL